MNTRVAVIGGGWAGCAAGLTLAQAGLDVTLFEAANILGGRARTVELNGHRLDNGQHILLGAYSQTLKLIAGVARQPGLPDAGLLRLPLAIDRPPDFTLACPRLPAPLHLLAGLLRARGIRLRDKWAAACWVQSALKTLPGANVSLAELMAGQPRKVREALWEPLCIAALNTPPDAASARVFTHVLWVAFGKIRAYSDLLFPQTDLSGLFPQPAGQHIRELNGQVHLNTRIGHLAIDGGKVELGTLRDTFRFDRVIVAVAPQHLRGLCGTIDKLGPSLRAVETYRYEPIATVYLQYPAEVRLSRPMLALSRGPAQFVFDRGQTHGQGGLLACVSSAASHLLGRAQAEWIAEIEKQLSCVVRVPPALWRKAIVEKQATYACLPDMQRPPNRTSHPWIYLAGDYTAGPYPATLESATLSGVESAQTLINDL